MKTRYWVIILVIVAIVVIGIVLFMYGYLPRPFVHGGKYRAINQYEVFRDLLVIILSLAGLAIVVLGASVYKVIYKGLDAKVEKCLKDLDVKAKEHSAGLDAKVKEIVSEQLNYETATLFLELSYDCWRAYEVKGEPKKEKWDQLDTALEQCRKALKRAKRLDMTQRKNELILCIAKNNRAYHLAARNRPKDSEKAISLAKYAYDKVDVFDFQKTSAWRETYAFVLIRMGTAEQRKEGQKIIKDFRHRRSLPKIMKNYINEKYTKNIFLKESWKRFKET